MKKVIFFLGLMLGTMLVWQACNETAASGNEEISEADASAEMVARGKYLISTMGCQDCHSPKRMGEKGPEIIPELDLSGHQAGTELPPFDTTTLKNGWVLFSPDLTASVGPWGTSYAANLTSDASGVGSWTEEHFMTALRKGKLKGLENGRDLLPPMPWQVFSLLTDEDLKAMFAYLQTVPPVKNVVPPPAPPAFTM